MQEAGEELSESRVAGGWKQVILTCMDYRIDTAVLHDRLARFAPDWWLPDEVPYVVRDAGAVATDDALRSMVALQRLAGPGVTPLRIAVVGHEPGCAMTRQTDAWLDEQVSRDVGTTPPFKGEFLGPVVDAGVWRALRRLELSPFLLARPEGGVSGFVYDTNSRMLRRPMPVEQPEG